MAKDVYHDTVKEILVDNSWTISNDPYVLLSKEEGGLEADLAAEKIISAEKGTKKIVVEIKSFINPSIMNDFHKAIGQYQVYQSALEIKQNDRTLYLAIPEEIYLKLIKREVVYYSLKKLNIKLLVFDPITKTIVKWIEKYD